MKPAPFEYAAPTTAEAAVEMLVRHGDDAKLLAGGQSLVPLMNLRLAAPEVLIDLNRVGGLGAIREDDGVLALGAMVRHAEVAASEAVRRRCPLLARAASLVGYPAIRVRGTLGGSIAHADPASELPLAAIALDAEVDALGPTGLRTLPARELFVGFFTTALEPGELLTEIRFPVLGEREGWAFEEFSRKSGDFAIAAVAATVTVADGRIARARLGIAGVGDRPRRSEEAEASLVGQVPTPDTLRSAAMMASSLAGSDGDQRYRRHLVEVLARRALRKAAWGR